MRALSNETEACEYIIGLVHERCGIRLNQGKEMLIRARLGKRIRQHSFNNLVEYCDYLRTGGDEEELARVVDALTTNFTSFLREKDHFEFLVTRALPMALPAGQKKFHIWSAGCSSGEEPCTLGFYLSEHYPAAEGWDWRILASDISTKVLDQARMGIYSEERVSSIPENWQRRYLQKGLGRWEGYYRVKRSLTDRIAYEQINLVEPYAHAQAFPVIFCRNVMIYFERAAQERIVGRLCEHLTPGGFLIIGHSESLNGLPLPLKCLRPSIYQKI